MLDVIIDLSHWNTIISWNDVQSSGIVGVIHKATEGTTLKDETYAARRPEARAAGLLWGAYHFGVAGDAMGQAHYFLDQVQPTPETLLVLDWEACVEGPSMTEEEVEAFVMTVAVETDRFPGLYSGMSFCHEQLTDIRVTWLSQCWLWLARYSTEPPDVPAPWPTWTMWQWSQSAIVPGIEGSCDRDRFNGHMAGLARLWHAPAPARHGDDLYV